MRRSDTRIPTTHTDSLPRNPDLVALYIRKFRGEPVDAEDVVSAKSALLSEGARIASGRVY